MRILHRYVAGSLTVSFLATFVVFTFVMSIGVGFKVADLLARNVAWRPIMLVLLSGIPGALALSIPVSALTCCLLVFGRYSADGEVAAMKACGVSLWSVARAPRILALGLVVVCLYINNELVPRAHLMRRSMVRRLGMESPQEMLTEGRFIRDFAGLTIYVESRDNDRLYNIRIYDLRNRKIRREARAKSGVIMVAENKNDLLLDLYDVRVDPFFDDRPGAMFCRRWPLTIPDATRAREYRKKEDDMTYGELLNGILNVAEHNPQLASDDLARERMLLLVELNKRLALSASCYAFVLLGIPLGIRTHRKESSVGVAISLGLMFSFFLFILVAESLAKRPETQPHLIVWLPVLISVLLGSVLLNRAD